MESKQALAELGFDPATTARLTELFKVTLEATCKKILAESQMSDGSLSKSPGTELKAADKLKAADLRIALLMGKIPEDTGLLIDATTFAKLLSISTRTLRRLTELKAVPQPVYLGSLVRWRLTGVLEWIEDDCPPQRKIEYQNILKPSVEYLEHCGRLMIDSSEMAKFLGVSQKVMTQLASTDRVPGPCRLGLGQCFRWSVLELLEWVEAGCPRRREWIKMQGRSGRYYS